MSRKLYEIRDDIEAAILIGVDQSTGEVVDEKASAAAELELDGLGGELRDKAIGCALYIKNQGADAEYYRGEARALKKRAEAFEAQARAREGDVEWLTDYLQRNLKGHDPIEDPRVAIRWKENPPHTVVDVPLDALPPSYRRVTLAADLDALKKHLKAGNVGEKKLASMYAHLERTEVLVIK